jgi:hypothetical protein
LSVWYFEERDRRAVLTFPKNEEHFAAVSGVVTSLIREITQNSGDAGVGSEPVQVLFRFGKLDGTRFADHIEGLPAHLHAFSDLRTVLEPAKTVPYLAIEDFGTTGLKGSYDLSADGADSNYVAFWRRYGESSKTDEHGGRHGLGKSTISTASKLRLFFGATVRSEDPAHHLLLQGQISLRPHKIGGKVFGAYGLWYDDTGNLPIIDQPATRFLHDFNLNRGRVPGLSVVIPFPHDDLTPDAIIRNVIEHAFHQIISGQLIVKVDDTTISPATISRLAETHQLPRLKSAMALSGDVRRGKFPSFAPRPDTSTRIRLRAEHFSEASLQNMRKRWAESEIVAVDMPVTIRPKKPGAKSGNGTINLYVRREQDTELARETYVRGRVTVPLKQIAGRSNCIGLLVADTGIASTFLGDAEPPAHHRWHMYRVRPHYHSSDTTLKRILFSLKDLLDLLEEGQDDQPFKDAFLEYLWFPKRDEEKDDDPPKPKPRPSPQPTPFPDDLVPVVTPHRLRRIDGGFAYSYNPEDDDDATAQIVASYRRRTGAKKAGKSAKYRDFRDELPVEESGSADLEQVPEPRRVVFRLANISPGYELQVTGFDTNRDIDLRFETVNA